MARTLKDTRASTRTWKAQFGLWNKRPWFPIVPQYNFRSTHCVWGEGLLKISIAETRKTGVHNTSRTDHHSVT